MNRLNVFGTVMFLAGGTLFAHPNDGISAAERLCEGLAFPSEIMQCNQFVSQAAYFDRDAVSVCKELPFAQKQLSCLRAIEGRTYSESNLNSCKRLGLGDQIRDCLKRSGRPRVVSITPERTTIVQTTHSNGLVTIGESSGSAIRREILKALNKLEKSKTDAARRILTSLLTEIRE